MTRLENIKSNSFLLGLNMSKATREQKIQWLCQIIDNETDKPEEEMDFALIGECSAYLRELSDQAAEATKEQKQRILQRIKTHHNQPATNSVKMLRPKWRTLGRIIAIAATVAAIMFSTLTVLAKVKGYSSAWEYVKENIQQIIGMDAGDKVNEGNITLTKHDGVVTYKSIEELLQEEGYDIMYPSELPEGVQLIKISEQIVSNHRTVYCYKFNDANLFVMVSTASKIFSEDLARYEVYTTRNMTFYIRQRADMSYQAIGYDKNYEYQVYCNDYDTLLIILNGIKELEK